MTTTTKNPIALNLSSCTPTEGREWARAFVRRGYHPDCERLHSPVVVEFTAEFACFSRMDSGRNRVTHRCPTWSAARGMLNAIYQDKLVVWHPLAVVFIKPTTYQTIGHNNGCQGRKSGRENTQFEITTLLNPHFVILAEMRPARNPNNISKARYGAILRNFYRHVRQGRPQNNALYMGMEKFDARMRIPHPSVEVDTNVNFTEYNVLRSIHELGDNHGITYYPKLVCRNGILHYPDRPGQWKESPHTSHQRITP